MFLKRADRISPQAALIFPQDGRSKSARRASRVKNGSHWIRQLLPQIFFSPLPNPGCCATLPQGQANSKPTKVQKIRASAILIASGQARRPRPLARPGLEHGGRPKRFRLFPGPLRARTRLLQVSSALHRSHSSGGRLSPGRAMCPRHLGESVPRKAAESTSPRGRSRRAS